MNARHQRIALLLLLFLFAPPAVAHAHVKWFSQFSFGVPPRTISEILSPLVLGLAVLSMVAIAVLVVVDRWLQERPWWQRVVAWLDAHKDQSTLVMRIATGATMLLAWQADALLVPGLHIENSAIGWAQFVIALLLIFPRTTPLAGIGVGLLYLYSGWVFGLFAMLDYMHYVGVAGYLALSEVSTKRIQALRLPLLYITVGFSLFWLGLEKLVYPSWGLYLIEQNPQLALGLPPEFFLTAAAFVELTLGYLLLIGLFERPLALIITLVFMTTTLVFGKIEIIGHTPIHAALIVFLLHGPGTVYPAPIRWHQNPRWRMAFGAVNFALVLIVLLPLYQAGAWYQYDNYHDTATLPDGSVAANAAHEESGRR